MACITTNKTTWHIVTLMYVRYIWAHSQHNIRRWHQPTWTQTNRAESLTCLLARIIKGRWESDTSSSCKCFLATGKSCGLEESTTNTRSRAFDMYLCQYGRSSSLPPTDRQQRTGKDSQTLLYSSGHRKWTRLRVHAYFLGTRCAGPLCWGRRRWSPASAAYPAPGARWPGSAAGWFYRLRPDPEPVPASLAAKAWTASHRQHILSEKMKQWS